MSHPNDLYPNFAFTPVSVEYAKQYFPRKKDAEIDRWVDVNGDSQLFEFKWSYTFVDLLMWTPDQRLVYIGTRS